MAPDVLVIGGGVIGLATAYYCAQRGHRVTVVDRRNAAHGGATRGNAGMIVPSHFIPLAAPGMVKLGLKWMWNPESPFYIKPRMNADLMDWGIKFWRASNPDHVTRSAPVLRDLHLASRALFEELSAVCDFGLVKKGLLMLCRSEHAWEEESKAADHARSLGVPAEVLDPKQTAALDPNVQMSIAGSVYFPKDCHLVPQRFLEMLKAELIRLGVRFHWDTEITGFNREGSRIKSVQTGDGEIAAQEYVLCGGSWSDPVGRDLDLKIPLQAGKGYSVTLQKPRQLPQICAIFAEARVAVTPMDGALRFGGTMEIAGLNESITPRRVQGIIKAVPNYYPDFRPDDFAGLEAWSGLRPCSPDGLPYMGRASRYRNLSVATGHGMMGLSLAPITGKLMAEVIEGQKSSINISILDPGRYQ